MAITSNEKLITGFNAGQKYKMKDLIGEGAFGSIYDCEMVESGEDHVNNLVVKVVKPNTSVKEMKVLKIMEKNIEGCKFPKAYDFGILSQEITESMCLEA